MLLLPLGEAVLLRHRSFLTELRRQPQRSTNPKPEKSVSSRQRERRDGSLTSDRLVPGPCTTQHQAN